MQRIFNLQEIETKYNERVHSAESVSSLLKFLKQNYQWNELNIICFRNGTQIIFKIGLFQIYLMH